MKRIVIINGPNLNLLGRREPGVYGTESMEDCLSSLKKMFPEVRIESFQSNSEGGLIDAIQDYGYAEDVDGIIFNPGAYAHYSYALADAVRAVPVPVVEVHISNIFGREEFRSRSVISSACRAVLSGFGLKGYGMAVSYFADKKD